MSRIHEALKRAEEQKPPAWRPADPTPLNYGEGSEVAAASGVMGSTLGETPRKFIQSQRVGLSWR